MVGCKSTQSLRMRHLLHPVEPEAAVPEVMPGRVDMAGEDQPGSFHIRWAQNLIDPQESASINEGQRDLHATRSLGVRDQKSFPGSAVGTARLSRYDS